MLFNEGIYVHETGFEISVNSEGEVMLSPNHPQSMRLSEFFDSKKWTVKGATTNTEVESEVG